MIEEKKHIEYTALISGSQTSFILPDFKMLSQDLSTNYLLSNFPVILTNWH